MGIQARCPECDKTYHLADQMLGRSVRCKQCAQVFTVKPGRQSAGDDEPAGRPTGIRAKAAPAPPPADDEAPRPRSRRDDGGDEPPHLLRKPQKKGSALTLWLILGGGGVLLLAGVIVLVLVLTRRSSDPNIPDVDLGGRWPEPVNLRGQVDPESYVRLQVAGVSNDYTREAVSEKAGQLADRGAGVTFTRGASEGDRMTIVIFPLRDVEGAARRIDFGEVRGVSGRTITVVARKVEGPPAGADAITRALFHMKMKSKKFRQQGLRELKDLPPEEPRRAEVAKGVEDYLAAETDVFRKADAVDVLARWGTKESAPALLRALNDPQRHVQAHALKALAALKEPSAVEPIAQRLESIWPDAGQALRAYGPQAEPALIKALDNPSQRTRELALEILKDTGTKACVPAVAKAVESRPLRHRALETLERLKAVEAADAIAACLDDFGSRGDAARILRGFGAEGEQALIKALDGPNKQAREAACEILRDTGTKACVPALVKALGDRSLRRNALQALDRLKAVEVAEGVARCLEESGERGEASRILKRFGPTAEKAVIPYLVSTDQGTRREACHILEEIGTQMCVPALFEAVRRDNGLRGDAERALKRIQARGK